MIKPERRLTFIADGKKYIGVISRYLESRPYPQLDVHHSQIEYWLSEIESQFKIEIVNQDKLVIAATKLIKSHYDAIRAANRILFRNEPNIGDHMAMSGDCELWCQACCKIRYGALGGLAYDGQELGLGQNYSDLSGMSCGGYPQCGTRWD